MAYITAAVMKCRSTSCETVAKVMQATIALTKDQISRIITDNNRRSHHHHRQQQQQQHQYVRLMQCPSKLRRLLSTLSLGRAHLTIFFLSSLVTFHLVDAMEIKSPMSDNVGLTVFAELYQTLHSSPLRGQ